jgi:HD-GYP domain-containing protein (c-di-GMP phosphodiesterase class II)
MMQKKAVLKAVEYEVRHLVPGMEVARHICSEDGKVLVAKGVLISRETISTLQKWNVQKVPIISQAPMAPITDPKLKRFIHKYNNSIVAVQKAFDVVRENQEIPIESMRAAAVEMVDSVREAGNVVDRLYDLPRCDDYTMHHSVNVSVITALIGVWLKLPSETVNALTLVGLLHDIGKSQLPPKLLNQSRLLKNNDYELYKLHIAYGEALVQRVPDLAESIISGIVQHHERIDGSGYPRGLIKEEIHPYAKIVAVADLYDEKLTINRAHDLAISPYTSLESLWDSAYKLDAEAFITFTDRMCDYIAGNIVALNDGRQGKVVFLNKRFPSRCIVKLNNGEVLNLMSNREVRIHHLVR